MQKIPINLAKPGMVLEKPATSETGQVLLAAGVSLTENHIRILANKGIKSIVVKGNPLDLEGLASAPSFEKRIKRMDYLFRHQDDPFMLKLKKFLQEYFQHKALAEMQTPEEGSE
jgi:hypothetical protein